MLFWYNPNITDAEEHERRADEFRRYAEELGLESVVGPYDVSAWWESIAGLEAEPEGGRRCSKCFSLRMAAAARAAHVARMSLFATTLTNSPHKSLAQVQEAGDAAAREAGVRFLPVDFKKRGGFERSSQLAAAHGLYRQDYCGCEFSKRERDARRSRRTR